MNVKEIAVSRSVRVNTGNYEATDFFLSAKAEIDPDFDDYEASIKELNKLVDRAMLLQLGLSYKTRGKDIDVKAITKLHGLKP